MDGLGLRVLQTRIERVAMPDRLLLGGGFFVGGGERKVLHFDLNSGY